MSKVFLLRVFAYCPERGNMANIWSYKSILFNNTEDAVKTGKQILQEQLQELFDKERFGETYRNIDELMKSENRNIDYIFEVQETDMAKLSTWTYKNIINQCGDLSIPEELAKYHNMIIQDPLYILWLFDYKGNLNSRWFCYAHDENRHSGGAWSYMIQDGIIFNPSDEKESAGTKFKAGDIVYEKHDEAEEKKLYVIFDCPLKLYKYFYNIYTCYSLNSDGCLVSEVFHEEDIALYKGKIPANYSWLSRLYKNEFKISDKDMEKLKKGKISFSKTPSYKDIKIITL